MARKRPVVLIVFAVVQIVFGVVCCCGPAMVLSGAMDAFLAFQDRLPQGPQQIRQADLWAGAAERVPWFPDYMFWSNVVSAVLCLLMVAGAVGLLRLRPWGWYVSLAWAVADFAVGAAGLFLMSAYIWPAMSATYETLLDQMPPPPPGRPDLRPMLAQSVQAGMLIGLVSGLVATLYPLVMLAVLWLPSLRTALRTEPGPAPAGSETLPSRP